MHGRESLSPITQDEANGEFALFDRKPPLQDAAAELLRGLLESPKSVSAKFFYDQRGSELFEAITQLPEYYLTRTELGLFDAHGDDFAAALGDDVCLVEYGSGSSVKIRKLLSSLSPRAYVPVDISREHLEAAARGLHADFPTLSVYPTCADFTGPFELPEPVADLRKVGFFPGSSIGNFEPAAAAAFLASAAETLGAGSRLLIGVDRKKDPTLLEAAYNDAAGVTAAFNLNLLRHVNQLLGTALEEADFEHRARYNAALGCIQMFLASRRDQAHELAGQEVRFARDEEVHTENSFKYHPDEFLEIAHRGGYRLLETWTDEREWFAVYLLEADG